MSRRVLLHPGILFCSGCGKELQPEHGTVIPQTLQWVYACTNTQCKQVGERLVIPIKSMVVLNAQP